LNLKGRGGDILYWQFSLSHLAILATYHMALCLKAIAGLTLTTSVITKIPLLRYTVLQVFTCYTSVTLGQGWCTW